MRNIEVNSLVTPIKEALIRVNIDINPSLLSKLKSTEKSETNPLSQEILKTLIDNAEIAESNRIPLCQDTGSAIFFIELGQEICLINGDLTTTINKAVAEAYSDGYLRKSIVTDPLFRRNNTLNNTPAIIHTEIVKGDKLTIHLMPKGAGSENMSRLFMLKPADGVKGLKNCVLETIVKAGGNPCPPLIVGIGVGGNFETTALLAKKALLRDLDDHHPEPMYSELEQSLLEEINCLNIGPMGLGGKTTALAVKIEYFPCHIASLPVAINLQCHSFRHATIVF
ncbi:MAG: fumarate hydratase [Candidatus Cloacimonetes bacterium]|nr:fumarate hydratase [Candidatus Cloacimonadota bacterium]